MRFLQRRFAHGVVFLVCFLVVAQSLAWAQRDRGTITGTVVDSSGALVPNASVTVTNLATGVSVDQKTDQTGLYSFPDLLPGEYSVTVEATGFDKTVVPRVVLQVNQVATTNFTLQVGAVTQTIEVKEAAPLLQPQNVTLGDVVAGPTVRQLPLNGRNFVQLLTLAAGVTPGSSSSSQESPILTSARGTTAVQINGQNDLATDYLLDGIDNNETTIGGIIIFPSIDAIQEFKVQTANSSAEFGRNSGGQVNVTLKSGTNAFHGDAFEFLRNSALDARNYFDPPSIPEFRMNQFGLTLGGPIKKDRTFFFGDYQGIRIAQAQSEVLTVPTALMRSGDFSELGPIYDPATYDPTTNTRQQFLNDSIPAARQSTAALNLINIMYPMPNLPGLANNYSFNPNRTANTDQFDTRIDHRMSDKDTLFGHYSLEHFTSGETFWAATVLPNNLFNNKSPLNSDPTITKTQSAMLGETHIFTPSVVNDLRFAYTRYAELSLNRLANIPAAQLVGINNVNVPSIAYSNGLPEIDIAGYSSIGEVSFLPFIPRINTFQFIDTLNYVHGNHRLEFGIDLRRRQFNFFQPPEQRGDFYFGGVFTDQPSTAAGGSGIADMMLGVPYVESLGVKFESFTGQRSNEWSGYMADSWKIAPKLTLDLGVRNELITPRTEVYNRQSNFDPNYPGGAFLLASEHAAMCGRALRCTDYTAIAPRIGIAYQLDNATVIRSAYGIFYDATGVNGYQGTIYSLFQNPPFTNTETVINSVTAPTTRMENGFPPVPAIPTVNGYVLSNALPGITLGGRWQDPYLKASNAQNWNLTIEREFTPTLLLGLSYVGSKGSRLMQFLAINQPVPGPGPVGPREPFPDWGGINGQSDSGSSTYHSLQFRAEKRASHGLTFGTTYTWAHNLGNVWDLGGSAAQDYYDRSADRGSTAFDIRNRLVGSYDWDLPMGRGKRYLGGVTGVADKIASGWHFDGIVTMQSGEPFTPGSLISTVNTGGGSRPDRICNGKLSHRTVNEWFDPGCFATPALYTYGDSGVGILAGPGTHQFDLSLMKDTHINETRYVQFRAEFFNAFNTPQFNNPNATIGSPGAGEIGGAGIPANFFRTSRQIQFALKFYF